MVDISIESNMQKILPNLYKKKKSQNLRKILYRSISPEHLGLSYSEFRDMPLYVILQMLDEHTEDIKRKNREMKKNSKK